ncbi:MAG TPA: hypothetical protein VGI88_10575, partial [Verrucomicrobiae bacterium]
GQLDHRFPKAPPLPFDATPTTQSPLNFIPLTIHSPDFPAFTISTYVDFSTMFFASFALNFIYQQRLATKTLP